MIAALVALVGAVVYGAADFFGGLATRQLRAVVVTGAAGLAGLVALALALPLLGGAWSARDAAWGALAGVFGAIALALLYACLAIGPMSILSPLTAVVSAIAPMLWGLLVKGESLSPIGYAGLGVALAAVVLVGFVPARHVVRPSLRGVTMAIGAGVAIGGFLIVIDLTEPASGLAPLVVSRATTVALTAAAIGAMLMGALRRGEPAASILAAPHATSGVRSRAWVAVVVCGLLDATANGAALAALRLGDLSIVSALTALYPAGTILLAGLVLRERIAAVQWAGLALALTAGAMLALA
ncbi:EamA family transporter [Microbacterium hominis]|uniref:EamA family transporter n=1 Tax=Microbacterium hominis TaxID=162426 RepID=A0A7D4TM29_9MICO|nr:EamA family transporter [Microbacterium hominis]QKJ18782.1 EamA family transporter [Microbacterium hominis]